MMMYNYYYMNQNILLYIAQNKNYYMNQNILLYNC